MIKYAIGLILLALIAIGIFFPKETKTEIEIKTTISEINSLSDEIVNMPFTKDGTAKVQNLLNGKKEDLKSKVTKLKSFGDFQLKPEIAKDLNNCLAENPKRIVEKHKDFQKEVTVDLNKLAELKVEHAKTDSDKTLKKIRDLTKTYEDKMEILEAFRSIVNGYLEIF